MLITDPLFERKIQNVAATDKATWQFLFFFLSDYEPLSSLISLLTSCHF